MRMGKSPLWPHSPVGWLRAGMMSMLEEWSGRRPVGVAGHWGVSKTSSRSPSCLSTCRSLEGFMAVTQGPRTPQQSYSQLPFTPAQAMLLSTGTSALCTPFPQPCVSLGSIPLVLLPLQAQDSSLQVPPLSPVLEALSAGLYPPSPHPQPCASSGLFSPSSTSPSVHLPLLMSLPAATLPSVS